MSVIAKLWDTLKEDKLLQKILKNSGYLLSSNVLSMGLSVIQSILAGRLLGVAGLGVIGTITAFASTINRLFSFRMNELVVKYFGDATTRNENERAAAVVKAAALGEMGSALLSFIVLVFIAPFAAGRLADDPTTAPLFILYGSMVLANFATETATGVLGVKNQFRNQAVVNLISSVLTASIIVWAFFSQHGMMEIMWAYLIGKVILGFGTAALGWREMNASLGRDWWKTSFSKLPPLKELAGFAFSTNISSTIIMLVRDNEALWIAWFLSPVEVGYAKRAGHHQPGAGAHHTLHLHHLSRDQPGRQQARLETPAPSAEAGNTHFRRVDRIDRHRLAIFGPWLLFYGVDFQPAYVPMLLFLIGLGFANIFFWNRPFLYWTADGALPLQPVLRYRQGRAGFPACSKIRFEF